MKTKDANRAVARAPEHQARPSTAEAQASSAEGSSPGDGYRVSLPMFDGPLDLLLHLVQKHELDILDIPIAFVTEKYTAYVQLFEDLNIDVASEYLVMAATLVHIKSRMLLPNPPEDDTAEGSEDVDIDPRAELVRRLLEYQKYKLAAEQLGQRHLLGRDVFPRGSTDDVAGGEAPLEGVSMFKLLDAFQAVLERTQRTQEHQIDFETFSITEKIGELSERLSRERRLVFHEIFSDRSNRAELIITFLAILEMTRLRLTRLSQDGPFAPIYIELRVTENEGAANLEPAEGGEAAPILEPMEDDAMAASLEPADDEAASLESVEDDEAASLESVEDDEAASLESVEDDAMAASLEPMEDDAMAASLEPGAEDLGNHQKYE